MPDDLLGHELEDWLPTSPLAGPPLPKFLNIYWPWYAIEEEIPPVEEILDFDLDLPTVAPQEIYPGTAITITCPVTSRCTSKQNIIVKCIIYEGSILPTHGTKITQKSSTTFSILPDETYNVTIYHTAIEGTIDRRDVEVEVYVGAKLVKQSEWDDVYYVVRPPEVPKPATITSIELDKTTVRQGEDITVKANIQSNFAGTAWIVFAHGRGTPSPGAGFRPLYNVQGDYLGWFPSGFDFVRYDLYTTNVITSGIELKVGDNAISYTFGLPRNLPLGKYTIYVAVMPPAANWYQWDEPYDWTVSESFTVLEEAPRLVVVEPIISQYLNGNMWLPGTYLKHAVDVGAFSKNRNWIYSSESTTRHLFREPPERGWPRDYYMEFLNPTTIIISDETRYPDIRFSRLVVDYVAIGIMVESDPPEDRYSRPTEYYTLEITGWLTYPDGHTEQKTLIDKTPRPVVYTFHRWNFHVVPFGTGPIAGEIREPMAPGKYTIRLKLVCKGITFVDETRSFTIVE